MHIFNSFYKIIFKLIKFQFLILSGNDVIKRALVLNTKQLYLILIVKLSKILNNYNCFAR